jgi:hypothetical protein
MKNSKTLTNIFIVSLILFSSVLTPMTLSAYQEEPEDDLCDQIEEGCKLGNPYMWWIHPVEHTIYDSGCEGAGDECRTLTEA